MKFVLEAAAATSRDSSPETEQSLLLLEGQLLPAAVRMSSIHPADSSVVHHKTIALAPPVLLEVPAE